MTSRDFCYWLQGYLEITSAGYTPEKAPSLSHEQLECVRKHLALVFTHEIDPSAGGPEHQAALNAIHDPAPAKPSFGGKTPDGKVYRC
jgi:hypothetical protein